MLSALCFGGLGEDVCSEAATASYRAGVSANSDWWYVPVLKQQHANLCKEEFVKDLPWLPNSVLSGYMYCKYSTEIWPELAKLSITVCMLMLVLRLMLVPILMLMKVNYLTI